MRTRWLAVVVGCCVSGLTGCAGFTPAHLGQVAGTIAGAAVAPGIGAPLGALIGMLTGSLVQHGIDKKTEARERVELHDQLNAGQAARAGASPTSSASSGAPTRVWVDETQRDGRVIPGHFEVRSIP